MRAQHNAQIKRKVARRGFGNMAGWSGKLPAFNDTKANPAVGLLVLFYAEVFDYVAGLTAIGSNRT